MDMVLKKIVMYLLIEIKFLHLKGNYVIDAAMGVVKNVLTERLK